MSKFLNGLLVTGAAAAVMTSLWGTSAQADEVPVPDSPTVGEAVQAVPVDEADVPQILKRTCVDTTGATACFESYGDKFYVKDTKKDGYSASATWSTNYGRQGSCTNSLGSGQWGVCNYNMKEGKEVRWLARRFDMPTQREIFPRSGLGIATI